MKILNCCFTLIAMVVILWSGGCQNTPDEEDTVAREIPECERFMRDYFKHPTPDAIDSHLRLIHANGYLRVPGNEKRLIGFYAQIFANNDDRILEWLNTVFGFPEDEYYIFLTALYFANTPKTRNYIDVLKNSKHKNIRTFINKIVLIQRPALNKFPIDNADNMETAWFSFYASGNLAFFEAILYTAIERLSNGGSYRGQMDACFSLRRHCNDDPILMQLIERYKKTCTFDEQEILDTVFSPNFVLKTKEP